MNDIVIPSHLLPSYREQSAAVRTRFDSLKAREVILTVSGLHKNFDSEGKSTVALKDINFNTHRRELLCVVGPSGCGKSTLVRILAGLEEHSAGDVLLLGQPVTGPGSDRGMVFQGYTLFPWLTVKKNVMFGLERGGMDKAGADREAMEGFAVMGLGGLAH